jgi:hypothetical protein
MAHAACWIPSLPSLCENSKVSAPKAQSVTAWGNAPGKGRRVLEVLKARNRNCRFQNTVVRRPPNIISRFQRWEVLTGPYLGRWPRLLHFAPLALKPEFSHGLYRSGFCTLSPASRAQLSNWWLGTWGLRPRLYAVVCSAGLDSGSMNNASAPLTAQKTPWQRARKQR